MKRLFTVAAALALMVAIFGCSSSDTPSGPGGGGNTTSTDTTTFSAADSVYTAKVNATNSTTPAYYSLDSISQVLHAALSAGSWNVALKRYYINLNGGASSSGGDVKGANLHRTDFAAVTIADTAGAVWAEDTAKLIVDTWYNYNFQTHVLSMNHYVYTMVDAEGDNYIKFRIDSLIGPTQTSMGTVKLIYVYNPTAGSTSLTGTPDTALIAVNSGTGYFDFSTKSQVTPVNPATSTGWDMSISNYEIRINGGISGPGKCAAFPEYGELADPTNFDGVTVQPANAPMFSDYNNSIFNGNVNDSTRDWYSYNDASHQLTSKNHVYLIKTGAAVYKFQIQSYYANINDVPTSAYYTIKWKKL